MKKAVAVVLTVIVGLLGSACTDSGPDEPESTPQVISAERLYQEREANASRYDLNYKGKWVTTTGVVGEIDSGEVRLVVDMDSYRALGGLFLDYIALNDLSTEEQAMAEKDQEFTATCRVGDYVLGTINLRECQTSVAPVSPTAALAGTPAPTATPTATSVAPVSPTAAPAGTPAPTITPTATPVPTATSTPVPTPTPTPAPVIGTTVEAGGSSYTVNQVLDPAPPGRYSSVDTGKRLVAVDITQIGIADGDSYYSGYFEIQDADGYVYSETYTDVDVEPDFPSGELYVGQIVRGWVTFEVPETATVVAVQARYEYSKTVTIAHLIPG